MKKKTTYKGYDIFVTKNGYFVVYKDGNLILTSMKMKECKRYINFIYYIDKNKIKI